MEVARRKKIMNTKDGMYRDTPDDHSHGMNLDDFDSRCAERDAEIVACAQALIGRRIVTMSGDDIVKLMDAAKSPAIMLVAEEGRLVAAYQSRIDGLQGSCGLVARGRVAWLKCGANPRLVSFAMLAWAADIKAASETARYSCALAISSKIQGRHVGDVRDIDIRLLQEFSAATGHTAIDIDVDEGGLVQGVFETNECPLKIEARKWGVKIGTNALAADAVVSLASHFYGKFLAGSMK